MSTSALHAFGYWFGSGSGASSSVWAGLIFGYSFRSCSVKPCDRNAIAYAPNASGWNTDPLCLMSLDTNECLRRPHALHCAFARQRPDSVESA